MSPIKLKSDKKNDLILNFIFREKKMFALNFLFGAKSKQQIQDQKDEQILLQEKYNQVLGELTSTRISKCHPHSLTTRQKSKSVDSIVTKESRVTCEKYNQVMRELILKYCGSNKSSCNNKRKSSPVEQILAPTEAGTTNYFEIKLEIKQLCELIKLRTQKAKYIGQLLVQYKTELEGDPALMAGIKDELLLAETLDVSLPWHYNQPFSAELDFVMN